MTVAAIHHAFTNVVWVLFANQLNLAGWFIIACVWLTCLVALDSLDRV